ncbi:MAG: hypothetical protein BMS9Abin23_1082 [Thermodesulfobacteriota bacterium]|nr:MAG: hypothetical protein BMS9Abin23_1082 [Thermodesulfobacteriota bacterium]
MLSRLFLFLLLPLLVLFQGCTLYGVTGRPEAEFTGARPESIRADAIVEFTEKESIRGRAVILVKRPGFLRVDLLGPLGIRLHILASDGRYIQFFSKGGVKTIDSEDPAFERYINPERLVSIMLGDGSGGSSSVLKGDKAGPGDRAIRYKDGLSGAEIIVSDLREINGAMIPHKIYMSFRGKELRIRYIGLTVDPEIKEEVFKIH